MHPKLLLDVIRRQAGTLGKAILESAMNAVDAKATRCNIKLSATTLEVSDNGLGFADRKSIEEFFETFGSPHDESEQKVYGTFRMGRGQIFSFGVNFWESGDWSMLVDIKNEGLDYHLMPLKPAKKGCQISVQLYDPLTLVALDDTIREVKKLVRWFGVHGIVVTLNGEVISLDPRKQPAKFWDKETDRCWLRFGGSGGFSMYNMGAYVKDYHDWQFGKSGEAVSKVGMKINFARNDIMSDCKVWRDIREFVSGEAAKSLTKTSSLDEAGRSRLAWSLALGQIPIGEVWKKKIITDVAGRHWPLSSLEWKAGEYHGKMAVAPTGHLLGDRIHQIKQAFVLSQTTLDRFRMTSVKDFLQQIEIWFKKFRRNEAWRQSWQAVELSSLTKGYESGFLPLDPKEFTIDEQIWLAMAHQTDKYRLGDREHLRRYIVGRSDSARAWTDGATYIAFDRKFLKSLQVGSLSSLHTFCHVLLHEYCHTTTDMETHVHGEEFYREYHDRHSYVGLWMTTLLWAVPTVLQKFKKKMTKQQMRLLDQAAATKSASLTGTAANPKE